jgi:hypothetical protein
MIDHIIEIEQAALALDQRGFGGRAIRMELARKSGN